MAQNKTNRTNQGAPEVDYIERLSRIGSFFFDIVKELYYGIVDKSFPYSSCAVAGSLLGLAIIWDFDIDLFERMGIGAYYPRGFFYLAYAFMVLFSPHFLWGLYRSLLKQRMLRKLACTFENTGLKNNLGKFPGFIFDRALDPYTRVMRLTMAHMPKSKFQGAKESLESSLQVYIDDFNEERRKGCLDIIYSHTPMPSIVKASLSNLERDAFIIGATRAGEITASLSDIPHLLVAGQTGGGKSTFLRWLITSFYKNNVTYEFTLIDLKGGLEFQTFEGLDRVLVVSDQLVGTTVLGQLVNEIETRKKILKENKCKDLEAYRLIPQEKRKPVPGVSAPLKFDRQIIVIDEAAEMFLAAGSSMVKVVQEARISASKIARMGRAVGIHLVIGTQRPDARALDTQVKANLAGKICFQMGDLSSSLVVLGNGRAKDLPSIPGRAIWQTGLRQIEVQVPFLGVDEAEKEFKGQTRKHMIEEKPKEKETKALDKGIGIDV